MLDESVLAALEAGRLAHLAALVRTEHELPPILASFYGVGADTGGLIMHRSHPAQADDERAALTAAGLDVAGLEAAGRLLMWDLEPGSPLEDQIAAHASMLQDALDRGFTAVWYSRFPAAGRFAAWKTVVHYDRVLEDAFRGRKVVSLCPYVVGHLDPCQMLDRFSTLAEFHDGVVVAAGGRVALYDAASLEHSGI
jgi:hypothetical protein